ncbi:hypothetical protein OOK41_05090 [Micromonospora sp. NBC_01655]|uniref:hypothetical protein n=1 Tax=Micromonospora sp. NBC_01655 TaxID=2975983 RepID=UPI0022532EEB|nr:hypothetical protein [Micromonospora sp. NBC_01655]MCX4469679.1 hypothetical protein [Micromonospora sp. NBC_01655]
MGGDVVDRLRGGGLAALAVLVVAAGVGWWRAEAPAVGPVGGPTATSGVDGPARGPGDGAGTPRTGSTSGDLVRVSPGEPLVFMVDPATGRVTSAGPRRRAVVVTEPGRVTVRYDAGTAYDENPDGGLGGLSTGTVWQARLTLRPGQPSQRRVVEATTRPHLVQYWCVGPGQLLLVTVRAGHRDSRRATCDGSLATMWLNRGDGPIRIELAAGAPGAVPIVVDARVAALTF